MQLSSSTMLTAATTGATGGSNSAIEIERLQRQLKNLQKSLVSLPGQGLAPNQAKEQMQLLNQQIQIVQAQLARLQALKGIEQAENRLQSQSASGGNSATAKARTTDKVTGASTSADARAQTRQQSHAAGTLAIEPASPPLVSVKA